MVKKEKDSTTEEKIKKAAHKVFTEKGYAAARTRDIAEVAGINLALLNYYFRSKEKLFDIIMLENLKQFFNGLKTVLNDESSSLETKIETIVSNYIDLLIQQPNLPLFILTEIRTNPKKLVANMGVKELLQKSHFMKQFAAAARQNKAMPLHPLHLIMNLMGMIVFPFVGSPILQSIGDLNPREFNALMLERKKLIPFWIKCILKGA